MFEVNELLSIHQFKIIGVDAQRGVCLHSDGSILTTSEYWPTREQAQAVLDKFQPKHVWVHGDVFKFKTDCDYGILIYLNHICEILPKLEYVDRECDTHSGLDYYLDSATFLFNIKDKL